MSAIVIAQNWIIDGIASLFLSNNFHLLKIYYWWIPVIVLPIVETLLFQAFGCWTLDLFDVPRHRALLITAFVFGVAHYPNENQWFDVLSAGITGIILSWMYIRRLGEDRPWQGCVEAAFVHILNNTIVYIYVILFAPETIELVNELFRGQSGNA